MGSAWLLILSVPEKMQSNYQPGYGVLRMNLVKENRWEGIIVNMGQGSTISTYQQVMK
jgi:hypothetical protein